MRGTVVAILIGLATFLLGWALPLAFPDVNAWLARAVVALGALIGAIGTGIWIGGVLPDGKKATGPAPLLEHTGGVRITNAANTPEPQVIDGGTFGSRAVDTGSFSNAEIEFERGKRAAKRSLSTEETTEVLGKAIRSYRDGNTGRFLTRSEAEKEPKVFDPEVSGYKQSRSEAWDKRRQGLKPDFPLASLVAMIKTISNPMEKSFDKDHKIGLLIMDNVMLNGLEMWGREGSQALTKLDSSFLHNAVLNIETGRLNVPAIAGSFHDLRFNLDQAKSLQGDLRLR